MNLQEISDLQGEIEGMQNTFYDLKEAFIDSEEYLQLESIFFLSLQVNKINRKIESFKTEKGIAIDSDQETIPSSLNYLFSLVASCADISKEELLKFKKSNIRENVQARQVHLYALKLTTKFSLNKIGAMYYEKDHATVTHAAKTIDGLLETSKDFRDQYSRVFEYVLEKIGDPIPLSKISKGLLKFKTESNSSCKKKTFTDLQ